MPPGLAGRAGAGGDGVAVAQDLDDADVAGEVPDLGVCLGLCVRPDAKDLADLLRMGRLQEAWIPPPAIRELRELVRHRAKLVALRPPARPRFTRCWLAKCGVQVSMTDLFGRAGTSLLDRVELPGVDRDRIDSLRRLMEILDFESASTSGSCGAGWRRSRLHSVADHSRDRADAGSGARGRDQGRAPLRRTAAAGQLQRAPEHHEPDIHVHRGRITTAHCGGGRSP